MFEVKNAAGVVVRSLATGNVLLVRNRRRGVWEYPGGLVHVGETPRWCAMRELREETGLQLRIKWILGVDRGQRHLYLWPLNYQTYAAWVPDELACAITLSAEHSAFRWFTVEEARTHPLVWERVRERFVTYLNDDHWPTVGGWRTPSPARGED
jgi:ADP-ribose pyrophosphatase YjhB (NUDIX family)